MEAFHGTDVNQAVPVNERVHWPTVWAPTRYMLLYPWKVRKSSKSWSEWCWNQVHPRGKRNLFMYCTLRFKQTPLDWTPSHVTSSLDICPESQTLKWTVFKMSPHHALPTWPPCLRWRPATLPSPQPGPWHHLDVPHQLTGLVSRCGPCAPQPPKQPGHSPQNSPWHPFREDNTCFSFSD